MSPESRRSGFEPNTTDTSEKNDTRKSKKRAILPATLISVAQKPVVNSETAKPTRLSEVFAGLLRNEQSEGPSSKNEEKTDASKVTKKESSTTEPQATTPEDLPTVTLHPEAPALADNVELSTAATNKENETELADNTEQVLAYERQEKQPNQIGIEGLLTLDGPGSVEEHVIPLHAEDVTAVALNLESEAAELPDTPFFRPQLEQQHQGKSREAAGEPPQPAAPETVAGGDGEVPPTDPPESRGASGEEAPEPNPDTDVTSEVVDPIVSDILGPTPTFRMAERPRPTTELFTKDEVEDRVYRATKIGQNRGVIAGLLVGGWYEHRKHKRREKRQAKELGQLKKNLVQAEKETAFNIAQHRQEQAATNARFEQAIIKQPEQLPRPEKQPAAIRKRFNQEIVPEQLEIPEDHRIETSAWHSIEVDAKTGKAVEKPTFQYGHEYYRERAHETSPVERRNAAAGEVALVAAAAAGTTAGISPQQSNTADASHPNKQQTPAQKAKSALTSVAKTSTAAGPLWPWVTALVIIALCIVAVITR